MLQEAPRSAHAEKDLCICLNTKNGAVEGTRTPDPRITNAVLYQLSYDSIKTNRSV